MKEKDLKETIGKKLEEAYLAKPMGQAPSEETVAKWIAIADQRRAERRRRKKKIISCAAACALCVCIGVTCVVKPPNAVTGGSGGNSIGEDLTKMSSYDSQDDLPDKIKENFILFKELPQGFELSESIVENGESFTKLSLDYYDNLNNEIFITEIRTSSDSGLTHMNDADTVKETWGDIDVYMKIYDSDQRETSYSFMFDDIMFSINVSDGVTKEDIKLMIEKAVRY